MSKLTDDEMRECWAARPRIRMKVRVCIDGYIIRSIFRGTHRAFYVKRVKGYDIMDRFRRFIDEMNDRWGDEDES